MIKYSFRKYLPFTRGQFCPSVQGGGPNIPIIDDDGAGLDSGEG